MSAGAPWSVKGIDPKAREVAKDLARRSGMTLGEWLNRVILEDDAPEEVSSQEHFGERPLRSPPPEVERMARALDRLSRTEADIAGPRSAEALAILEARISHIEAAVAQPPAWDAVLERLTDRLSAADQRFEALAADLTRRVDLVRDEVSSQPFSPSGVESRLADVEARLAEAEQRSARTVAQMGQQVLAMAEAVNRRLVAAEQASAGALAQVGGEIARVAGAVEARLARAEHAQAESLDRLGAEIGRIADRLSERMVASERRAAAAIEDVGQQVARVTERIEQRHERAAGDLAERMRQSEARAALLIESARVRAEGREPSVVDAPVPAEPPQGPFGPELFSRAEPFGEAAVDPVRPSFAPEDFAAAEGFAPLADAEDDVFEQEPPEAARADGARPLSTREVIDQARAAARAAQASAPEPVQVRAKLGRQQASGRMFNGFGESRPRRRGATAVQTALMVAGSAAFLSVGAAGVVLMNGPTDQSGQAIAAAETPRAAVALGPAPAGAARAEAGRAPETSEERAFSEAVSQAEAGKAGGLGKLKAVADAGYPPAQFYLAQLYETGRLGVKTDMVEARRWTARAAEGGEPGAMHNLGLYFFRGEGGPQDLASAAQWFRKAAEAGVVDSQFNLGLMYQSGSGVQANRGEALKWFGRAAAQGDRAARQAVEELTSKGQG